MNTILLVVQPDSLEPIYCQIVGQLRRMIAGGQIASGELLPSVRTVAGALSVNPMTVSRAYGIAEAEGLLDRKRGKGMVVADGRKMRQNETGRLALLAVPMQALARQVQELNLPAGVVLKSLAKLLEQPERAAPRRNQARGRAVMGRQKAAALESA